MTRRMYWGVAILILLLGTAAVFIIVNERPENSKLNVQLDDAEKLAKQIEKRKITEDNRPSNSKVPTEDAITEGADESDNVDSNCPDFI